MIHGRRVDLGLGSADLVKLTGARRVARAERPVPDIEINVKAHDEG